MVSSAFAVLSRFGGIETGNEDEPTDSKHPSASDFVLLLRGIGPLAREITM
jgi:hypothetical protein